MPKSCQEQPAVDFSLHCEVIFGYYTACKIGESAMLITPSRLILVFHIKPLLHADVCMVLVN
jgi:hypothetical protein